MSSCRLLTNWRCCDGRFPPPSRSRRKYVGRRDRASRCEKGFTRNVTVQNKLTFARREHRARREEWHRAARHRVVEVRKELVGVFLPKRAHVVHDLAGVVHDAKLARAVQLAPPLRLAPLVELQSRAVVRRRRADEGRVRLLRRGTVARRERRDVRAVARARVEHAVVVDHGEQPERLTAGLFPLHEVDDRLVVDVRDGGVVDALGDVERLLLSRQRGEGERVQL